MCCFFCAQYIVPIQDVIPNFDTGSTFFEQWYFRDMVNTTWFPLAQAILYLIMIILGWAFINVVNMKRSNPFTSGNLTYGSFVIMLKITPLFFMLSGIVALRQREDLSGYCPPEDDDYTVKDSSMMMQR